MGAAQPPKLLIPPMGAAMLGCAHPMSLPPARPAGAGERAHPTGTHLHVYGRAHGGAGERGQVTVGLDSGGVTAAGPRAMLEPPPQHLCRGAVTVCPPLGVWPGTMRKAESVFLSWLSCPTLSRGAGPLCPATWSGGRQQVGLSVLFAWLVLVLSTFPKLLREASYAWAFCLDSCYGCHRKLWKAFH